MKRTFDMDFRGVTLEVTVNYIPPHEPVFDDLGEGELELLEVKHQGVDMWDALDEVLDEIEDAAWEVMQNEL